MLSVGWAMPALAGSGAGTAKTSVLGPVAMLNTAPLDFGGIVPSGGGTVTVDAQTGTRSGTGVVLAGGTVSNARFIATGTPNQVVTIALNPTPIVVVNGANNMSINQIRVSVNGGGPQPVGPNANLGPLGVINYAVGGRLTVAGSQADGLYTGTFTLTMDYQ
ncbi:DUF4402 domain-containing protein [Sphingomonas sp. SUN039]|uniref:DUF4402 domain-containing protein n=1 Tax=Sphingomonas sp. SUN039 TaxID=2937787 RepID=UPI0021649374|nr:DUF4402 domain-containing protein [Sphingomonas sp. SUN039]UVO55918.1 DUF4402 domain-containing protein [Sphingomonas sp. SUN039]